MEQYEVTILAGGSPFWCVDEERRLLDWIDRRSGSRFSMKASMPTVRTISLDASSTALELRWTSVEASGPWVAAEQVIKSIEPEFPDIVSSSFLRVQTTLQVDADTSEDRWVKQARTRR